MKTLIYDAVDDWIIVMKIEKVVMRTVGNYAVCIAACGIGVFIYTLFIWDRFMMMLSLSFVNVGLLVAVIGLVLDKNKNRSIIAILLCLIPYLYLVLVAE